MIDSNSHSYTTQRCVITDTPSFDCNHCCTKRLLELEIQFNKKINELNKKLDEAALRHNRKFAKEILSLNVSNSYTH